MLHKSEKCFRQGTLRSISTKSIIDLLVILSSSNSYSVSHAVSQSIIYFNLKQEEKRKNKFKDEIKP